MMHKDAILSPCGTYRYLLQRSWNVRLESVCFIMLNPSTADAELDDPTIRKCIGFAQRLGFGQLEVVNLFATRCTDPDLISDNPDPYGPENTRIVTDSVSTCNKVICAWGAHRMARTAGIGMRALLSSLGKAPKALRLTNHGHPGHPLFIPYTARPVEFV